MTGDTMTPDLDAIVEALTSEDELSHGEAWHNGQGIGRCAYDEEPWPCEHQQKVTRLREHFDALQSRLAVLEGALRELRDASTSIDGRIDNGLERLVAAETAAASLLTPDPDSEERTA